MHSLISHIVHLAERKHMIQVYSHDEMHLANKTSYNVHQSTLGLFILNNLYFCVNKNEVLCRIYLFCSCNSELCHVVTPAGQMSTNRDQRASFHGCLIFSNPTACAFHAE